MIFLASYSILCMSITSFFLLLPYSEAYYFQWESRGSEWFKCLPPFRLLCFCPWEQIEKVVDQHIQQQREKEASGRVGGPVLKRCLGGRDLSASVILPLRESPDLLSAVPLNTPAFHFLVPCLCSGQLTSSKIHVLMSILHSGQETVQSDPSFAVEKENTEGGWQSWKEGSACGLASGLLFPAGFAMVLGPKLPIKRGACVCLWMCSWHSEPLVTTVLQRESERTGSGACMPSNQTHTLIKTYSVCTHIHAPKMPISFTHIAVYVLWVQLLSKCTDVFRFSF